MNAPQNTCGLQNIREGCSFSISARFGDGNLEVRQKPVPGPALQTSNRKDAQRLRNKTEASVSSRRNPIHSASTSFFCR